MPLILPPQQNGGCSSVGRAPVCGSGCRGFKSRHSPHFFSVLMEALFQTLGIEPKNLSLYERALTHPSFRINHKQAPHYERLEFLGDAVIEMISTEFIFHQFPQYKEGPMTKLRAKVVSRPSLAEFAQSISLGDFLRLNSAEEENNGRTKATNLCNAYEALLGAIYLDLGFSQAKQVFLKHAQTKLEEGYPDVPIEDNPKGALQELLQAKGDGGPEYTILSSDGPDHLRTFISQVSWNEMILGTGSGTSKKTADAEAAKDALQKRLWK